MLSGGDRRGPGPTAPQVRKGRGWHGGLGAGAVGSGRGVGTGGPAEPHPGPGWPDAPSATGQCLCRSAHRGAVLSGMQTGGLLLGADWAQAWRPLWAVMGGEALTSSHGPRPPPRDSRGTHAGHRPPTGSRVCHRVPSVGTGARSPPSPDTCR